MELVKLPVPEPLGVRLSAIDGVEQALQQTPRSTTGVPPSDITVPPHVADVNVMSVTAVVVTIGTVVSCPVALSLPHLMQKLPRSNRMPAAVALSHLVCEEETNLRWLLIVLSTLEHDQADESRFRASGHVLSLAHFMVPFLYVDDLIYDTPDVN